MEDLAFRILNIRSGVWALVLLFSCFMSSNFAEAEPIPRNFYPISLSNDPERLHFIQRMEQLVERERDINEQEREITDEVIELERLLEAKGDMDNPNFSLQQEFGQEEDRAEQLPVPLAFHAGTPPLHWQNKRGSYMALCHFKICNMGRKRQLQMPQIRPKVRSLKSRVSLSPRTSGTLLRQPIS